MKISVITAAYNSEKNIRKTIESVLYQKKRPYEYIIIDGCSQDRTVEIANEYKKIFNKLGIKYRILSEEDDGIYDAFNKGVKQVTGDFITFLNSDDWYEKDALSTMEKAYMDNPYDIAYGTIRYICKGKKSVIKKSKIDKFVSSRNWNHPSCIVKRELYLNDPFESKYRVYADFHWYLKMRKAFINITILPPNIVITNFTAGGASINCDIKASLQRANEKYHAYVDAGFSKVYLLEAYGWEFAKFLFAKIFT